MKLCQCFNALGEGNAQNKHHLASPWVRQDVILPHQTFELVVLCVFLLQLLWFSTKELGKF
jgi:hypothetical protein